MRKSEGGEVFRPPERRQMIDIIDYIPKGRENAISRHRLAQILGMKDRKIRKLISDYKKEEVICSLDDGSGYFIPTIEDEAYVKAYRGREKSKALSILKTLSKVNAWLCDAKHGRLEEQRSGQF